MEFFVYETSETIKGAAATDRGHHVEQRKGACRTRSAPRWLFHYIRFPDPDTMRAIIDVHFPGISSGCRRGAQAVLPGSAKCRPEEEPPSELLDWLKLCGGRHRAGDVARRVPKRLIPPLHGALI